MILFQIIYYDQIITTVYSFATHVLVLLSGTHTHAHTMYYIMDGISHTHTHTHTKMLIQTDFANQNYNVVVTNIVIIVMVP